MSATKVELDVLAEPLASTFTVSVSLAAPPQGDLLDDLAPGTYACTAVVDP